MNLHGRGGHQKQAKRAILQPSPSIPSHEQLQQAVGPVAGNQKVLATGVVRLVHDDQVPRAGRQQIWLALAPFGQLAGGDEDVLSVPGVGNIGRMLLLLPEHVAEVAAIEEGNVEGKLLVELFLPLAADRSGGQYQAAADVARQDELAQHQPGLDGLAQADLVTQQEPFREASNDGIGNAGLVRPWGHGARCRAQPSSVEEIGSVAQKLEEDTLTLQLGDENAWDFDHPGLGLTLQWVTGRSSSRAIAEQLLPRCLGHVQRDPVWLLAVPQVLEPIAHLDQVGRSRIPGAKDHKLLIVELPGCSRLIHAAAEGDLVAVAVGEEALFGVVVVLGLGCGERAAVRPFGEHDPDLESA